MNRTRGVRTWFGAILFERLLVAGLSLPAEQVPVRRNENPDWLLGEADRLSWLKNWAKAEPLYSQAERLFAAKGDGRNALYARVSKLRGQMQSLPPDTVSQEIDRVLRNPLIEADPELKLRCLVVKGDADMDINSNLAERDWTEALQIAEQLKNADWASRASGELGVIAFLHGDSATAMIKVRAAINHAQQAHDAGALYRYLTLMADGLAEFGEGERALKLYDQALGIAAEQKDFSVPVLTLTGKASTLVRLERYTEAEALVKQGLRLVQTTGNLGYQSELLIELGKIALKMGNQQVAIEHLQKSAELANRVGAFRMQAHAKYELATLYEKRGEIQKAEEQIVSGIAASRRAGDRYYLPRYLAQYAKLAASEGRTARAEALFGEATDLLNGILADVSSPAAKGDLVATMTELYLNHFVLEADHGRIAKAFAVIEEARGRSVSDFLTDSPNRRGSVSARLGKAAQRIAQLQAQLWKSQASAFRQRLLDQIFDAEEDFGPAQAEMFRQWRQIRTKPLSIADVIACLKVDEALVEYVIGEPSSYALVLSASGAHLFKLARQSEINEAVGAHLAAIQSRSDIGRTGKQLYSMLISPLQACVNGARHLVFVPDASLNGLPFETLAQPSGRLMLNAYVIGYSPSAGVLTLLRRAHRILPRVVPKILFSVRGVC